MLWMALVHSPYPHATIKNIDSTAALAVPGVKAVITAKISKEPTCLDSDLPRLRQADGAGRRQGAVPVPRSRRRHRRDTRGRARRSQLVEVEYEELPVVANPFDAKTDKVILRDDRENKTNHIYHWEVGDRDKTTARWRMRKSRSSSVSGSSAAIRRRSNVRHRRRHEQSDGRLTMYMTSQAPHAHRTVVSLVTGIPEDKIHVISPDIGGGFATKFPSIRATSSRRRRR